MATWIFQGNPEVFDIDGYLAASSGLIVWRVSRYAELITPGDSVYIWKSQGNSPRSSGIVAEGTIVDRPRIQEDDHGAEHFWVQSPEQDRLMRVEVRLNRIANKKETLKRDWMKEDSVLKDLLILRQAAGTNFPVEKNEAERLGRLWRKTGNDWGRDEIVAALWLYESGFGKPISKSARSPVENISQIIGRTPTGVYNKLMNIRALDPRVEQKDFTGGSKLDQLVWHEFFSEQSITVDMIRLQREYDRLWGDGVVSDRNSDEVLEDEQKRLSKRTVADLLLQYSNRSKNTRPRRKSQQSIVYDRDPIIIVLRKKLAHHKCEVEECKVQTFTANSGELFVEVHHLVPLSQGGPDTLENTVTLCPTHHRQLHFGKDAESMTQRLIEMRQKEQPIK